MTVQADHVVGCAHHDLQVVADHQDGAAVARAHRFDAGIERRRRGLVQPRRRLVEDQQVGPVQQRARQEHALKLPARQAGDLLARDPRQTRVGQRRCDRGGVAAPGQVHEASDRDRH